MIERIENLVTFRLEHGLDDVYGVKTGNDRVHVRAGILDIHGVHDFSEVLVVCRFSFPVKVRGVNGRKRERE